MNKTFLWSRVVNSNKIACKKINSTIYYSGGITLNRDGSLTEDGKWSYSPEPLLVSDLNQDDTLTQNPGY